MQESLSTPSAEQSAPSYYAVIPAAVRYDAELQSGCKLMYGEITALANADGFCWAKNAYFADLYGTSIRTVQRWINQLETRGYIRREVVLKEESEEVDLRKIWLVNPHDKNVTGWGQKCQGGGDKNVTQNNTSINITPYSPPRGDGEDEQKTPKTPTAGKAGAETRKAELEKWFDILWAEYPKKVDKQDARQKFMRLAPDRELMTTMWRALKAQKGSDQWQRGFIPSPRRWIGKKLWEDELPPAGAASPSRVVEAEEVTYW